MTTVLHRHMRELGYCNRGARDWFARQGLSWPDFVEHGIDAEQLRATGDAMAERAIERAEEENNGQ
jgi:hypothetical protein